MLLTLPYLRELCEWNLPIHEKHTPYMDGQGPCILRAAVGERKTDEDGLGRLTSWKLFWLEMRYEISSSEIE